MSAAAILDDIARGDANPAQVRILFEQILEQKSLGSLQDLYHALRAWTWKALDQRRRDSELRDWNDIICSVSAIAGEAEPTISHKLSVLSELLIESIVLETKLAIIDIASYLHVIKILVYISSHGEVSRRADIGAHLALGQANLSRVLNLMTAAGFLERQSHGKEASFRLTHAGREALQKRSRPNIAVRQTPKQSDLLAMLTIMEDTGFLEEHGYFKNRRVRPSYKKNSGSRINIKTLKHKREREREAENEMQVEQAIAAA